MGSSRPLACLRFTGLSWPARLAPTRRLGPTQAPSHGRRPTRLFGIRSYTYRPGPGFSTPTPSWGPAVSLLGNRSGRVVVGPGWRRRWPGCYRLWPGLDSRLLPGPNRKRPLDIGPHRSTRRPGWNKRRPGRCLRPNDGRKGVASRNSPNCGTALWLSRRHPGPPVAPGFAGRCPGAPGNRQPHQRLKSWERRIGNRHPSRGSWCDG